MASSLDHEREGSSKSSTENMLGEFIDIYKNQFTI